MSLSVSPSPSMSPSRSASPTPSQTPNNLSPGFGEKSKSTRAVRRRMSSEERREFDNPFPDFITSGTIESFVVPSGDKINVEWHDRLTECIKRLLPTLEYGVQHEVDPSDTTVYTGSAGVALFYLHMHKNFNNKCGYLKIAQDMVRPGLKQLKQKKWSFLGGDAGLIACACVFFHYSRNDKECFANLEILLNMESNVLEEPSETPDELLFGRAGYLAALLFVRSHLGLHAVKAETVRKVVASIIRSGQNCAAAGKFSCPLMYMWHDNHYLGAAHGLAGIFFTLLRTPEFLENQEWMRLVERTIDYLITLRFPSGNYPSSLRSRDRDRLVHWCHGAPGFSHLFVQAYQVYKKDLYLQEAQSCTEVVWKRGILRKGYGLCHGVAGNGYTFIALYRLTCDQKYLYRALKFAEWICDYGKHGCRTADRPYSLFEGLAGTLYYLVDLLHPNAAELPAFY